MDEDTTTNGNGAMTTTVGEREIVLERTFDAPRDKIFQAYTDPDQIIQWWGPKDWITTVYTMEVKPGGTWHYCMRGPESKESWGKATYHEVKPVSRLKYTDNFADAEGNIIKGMPEMTTTIEFVEFEGKTRLVWRVEFAATADLESVLAMGMIQGAGESWDRLSDYLAGQRSETPIASM